MKTLLAAIAALIAAAWGWGFLVAAVPPNAHPLWVARREALLLGGLLALAFMSLAMLLATRPAWAEKPLGGMDRVYRTHKWAGILAVAFGAAHWLAELSGGLLKSTIGRAGRPPKESFSGALETLRHVAGDMGEWAIYALLALLVVSLWKRFPYRAWRFLHRAMPLLYLMLAFHAALLAPRAWWSQPAGAVLALCLAAGVYGAVHVLAGRVGRKRAVDGEVVAVERPAPGVLDVVCRLGAGWPGHRPGQFAFVTFDGREGAHPFTLAGADRGDGRVRFAIKALGDYTARLGERLRPGAAVSVEGPYGCFDIARCDRAARQIWIAGGIGVTPFLAWLESLQAAPAEAPAADLHYCTRERAGDGFVARLEALCAGLPGVRLHVHADDGGGRLDAAALGADRRSEIWFCGPTGLADALRAGLRRLGLAPRFHREAFEMR
ncbi:MAG: ferric reductase-like transmembrane domain-containing protein [Rhodocyclaceae bacterium]|nr:ferric reductase-like transmembrane domain-containing protein [Rhodocyclaceae bacterium]